MSRTATATHAQLATALRRRVEDSGTLERGLREGILVRASGGPAVSEPYDALAQQIAEDSARVSDAHVVAVLEVAGSEKNAFEVILAAAIGAGLRRWDAAVRAIDEAGDAAS